MAGEYNVSKMQLRKQASPSLLGGFHGADLPPFHQYYKEAKTAFALLLAFGFPRQ